MANRLLTILLVLLMLCSSAFLTACDEANAPIVTDTSSSETSEPGMETETDEVTMLPAQDIRVISMNMSYDVENMEERRALMMPLLLSYDPDSIGTQENGGRPLWHEYFKEDMPNYERVGYFSNGLLETDDHYVRDPYTGHYIYYSANYIYYNADKYRCLDWNTIWLSRTPNRLNSYDGCLLRTCTWAILEDKETGFRYAHVDAHLGYEYESVNMYQISLVQSLMLKFQKLGLPVFATGDFNTRQGSSSYQLMIGAPEIDDSKFAAGKDDGRTPIDYCFVTGEMMTVHDYQVIETTINGLELTDHDGIFAYATVHSLPDTYKHGAVPSNEGITPTEVYCSEYVYDFTFTQADDIDLIDEYYVELLDADGNLVDERNIHSGHMDYEVPSKIPCTFAALDPETEYEVRIYAVNMIGAMSDPVSFKFTTAAAKQ